MYAYVHVTQGKYFNEKIVYKIPITFTVNAFETILYFKV